MSLDELDTARRQLIDLDLLAHQPPLYQVLSLTQVQVVPRAGDKMEETEWHRISFFDRQAEIAGEYLKKGSSVYVEGRLKTRKWTDKEGVERYTTEIIADVMQLLGARQGMGGGQQGPDDDNGGYTERAAPTQRSAPAARPAQAAAAPAQRQAAKPATGFDNMDDDIPF